MSIHNFIPTVWAARLLQNLQNNLVYGQDAVVNRDYEGEITEMGDSVKIMSIGGIEIGDYARNQDMDPPQVLDDAGTTMIIDHSRYFNFYVDNLDRVQANPARMDAAMQEAGYAMANDTDKWLAEKMVSEAGNSATGNGGDNIIGTDANPIQLGLGSGDKSAYETLVDLSTKMDEANLPPDGRYAIIPPWFHGLLLKDNRFTGYGTPANRETLQRGLVGEVAGLSILRSNNVPTRSGTKWKIVGSHRITTTLATQFTRIVGYEPEKRFGDAVKGLKLEGAKVTRPSGVIVLTASKGTV